MSIRESAVKKLKDGNVLDLTKGEKYFLMRQCAKVENYEKVMREINYTTRKVLNENTFMK